MSWHLDVRVLGGHLVERRVATSARSRARSPCRSDVNRPTAPACELERPGGTMRSTWVRPVLAGVVDGAVVPDAPRAVVDAAQEARARSARRFPLSRRRAEVRVDVGLRAQDEDPLLRPDVRRVEPGIPDPALENRIGLSCRLWERAVRDRRAEVPRMRGGTELVPRYSWRSGANSASARAAAGMISGPIPSPGRTATFIVGS